VPTKKLSAKKTYFHNPCLNCHQCSRLFRNMFPTTNRLNVLSPPRRVVRVTLGIRISSRKSLHATPRDAVHHTFEPADHRATRHPFDLKSRLLATQHYSRMGRSNCQLWTLPHGSDKGCRLPSAVRPMDAIITQNASHDCIAARTLLRSPHDDDDIPF
jgi:hypothetical protein